MNRFSQRDNTNKTHSSFVRQIIVNNIIKSIRAIIIFIEFILFGFTWIINCTQTYN